MATSDSCCTLVPYFTIHDGKIDEFKALCERFVEATAKEDDVLFYGFTFDGAVAHCREGYGSADGVLAHLENVGPLLQEALQIADLTRLEVHAPEGAVDRLRTALADLNPQCFTLEYGFRR